MEYRDEIPVITANNLFLVMVVVILALITPSIIQDILLYSYDGLSKSAAEKKIWMLDVDVEYSLYTWLSTVNLFFAAQLLLLVGYEKWKFNQNSYMHLLLLSLVFLFLSADEALSFHEKISGAIKSAFHASGIFHFAWVIPALAILILGLIIYFPFIWSLNPSIRYPMLLSALMFLSGAVGMEMVGGSYAERFGVETLAYRLMANLEEALEGLGVAVFIWSVLRLRQEIYRNQAGTVTSSLLTRQQDMISKSLFPEKPEMGSRNSAQLLNSGTSGSVNRSDKKAPCCIDE